MINKKNKVCSRKKIQRIFSSEDTFFTNYTPIYGKDTYNFNFKVKMLNIKNTILTFNMGLFTIRQRKN